MKTFLSALFTVMLFACGEVPQEAKPKPEFVFQDGTCHDCKQTVAEPPTSVTIKTEHHKPTDSVEQVYGISVSYQSFSGYTDWHDVRTVVWGDNITILRYQVTNSLSVPVTMTTTWISYDNYDVDVKNCRLYSVGVSSATMLSENPTTWIDDDENSNGYDYWLELNNFSHNIEPGTEGFEVHCDLFPHTSSNFNTIFIGTQYIGFGDLGSLKWSGAYIQINLK